MGVSVKQAKRRFEVTAFKTTLRRALDMFINETCTADLKCELTARESKGPSRCYSHDIHEGLNRVWLTVLLRVYTFLVHPRFG